MNIEKAMQWAVSIGEGTGEAVEVTVARAKALALAMAAWEEEVRRSQPVFVERKDPRASLKGFWP